MEIFDLLEDYLVDQDDGLKKLLTWFLNLVQPSLNKPNFR